MSTKSLSRKPSKLVGFFDSHYPHTININPILNYLKANPPDIFVLGGDNLSFDCISHWNDENFKNIGFDQIKKTLTNEINGFKKQLIEFRKAMPNTRFVYILGNHEYWLPMFCQKYPQMSDMSLENLLDTKKLKIEVIPFGRYFKYGKLYLAHGHQFGTDNPAKQAVVRTHKSVAFGHHHVQIMWSDFSDFDAKEKHIGISVPCYANVAPAYGKGRPNRWINGFLIVNFEPSGYFYPTVQHVAQDGKFITQDGKEWKN